MSTARSANEVSVRRRGPGSRADASHPTRHQLLDAALHVAERDGLAALSVNNITTQAGLAKGTFYVHFADRTGLIVEMHKRFHDELFAVIVSSTKHEVPGPHRAAKRLIAFLDGCRTQRGVRSLLLEASAQPELRGEAKRRNEQAARVIAADLRSSKSGALALDTARLLVAATAETASRELAANRALPRLRAALVALTQPGR
jgi:TetR/AcrR family transcriptional regulator, transcriptional repressor for nem operon